MQCVSLARSCAGHGGRGDLLWPVQPQPSSSMGAACVGAHRRPGVIQGGPSRSCRGLMRERSGEVMGTYVASFKALTCVHPGKPCRVQLSGLLVLTVRGWGQSPRCPSPGQGTNIRRWNFCIAA